MTIPKLPSLERGFIERTNSMNPLIVTTRRRLFFGVILLLIAVVYMKDSSEPDKSKGYDYDFAVYANNEVLTFEREDDAITLLERVPRSGEKTVFFWKEDFIEHEGVYFTKTSANKHNYQLLAKVNPRTLAVDYYQTEGIDGAFSMALDNQYLYISNSYVDRLEFSKYDFEFNFISKKVISVDCTALPNQMIVKGDSLYVLMGLVSPEGTLNNQIWTMDKDFEVKDTIDLNYTAGALMRMVLVDETFYLTNPNEGLTSAGEPARPIKSLVITLKQVSRKPSNWKHPILLKSFMINKDII